MRTTVRALLDLLRGAPRHPVGADGRMHLVDHMREFRARLIRSVLVLVAVFVVTLFYYETLLDFVLAPYTDAREQLGQSTDTAVYIAGLSALVLQLKLCGTAALVISSPYWLSQIWGFIMPGLHPHERRWSRTFAVVAGPLFILGVITGYLVLPKGIEVLIGFTPDSVQNLMEFGAYFTFLTRMLLVFGIAFEIPIFVVLLNLAGVVSGQQIARYRPWIVIGTFIFAAVATPSTDPFSMLMLAIPMLVLFLLAEGITRSLDRARAQRAGTQQWADDEASPL